LYAAEMDEKSFEQLRTELEVDAARRRRAWLVRVALSTMAAGAFGSLAGYADEKPILWVHVVLLAPWLLVSIKDNLDGRNR
jgi:hypothetical protein